MFFSSPPFYTENVKLPLEDTAVPPEIKNNPKFYPFFKDALGAIDGSHINSCPSAAERQANRDRKGGLTQNCLAACGFNMNFFYIISGWEGSASDAMMYHDARVTDLRVPEGKYYLADAGFPICTPLIIPYRGTRYHLQEWGRANVRSVLLSFNVILLIIFFIDLQMLKNCSISAMHQRAMSSNDALAF